MKYIVLALALAVGSAWADSKTEPTPKETVKVCVDVKDKEGKPVKDAKGNTKQNCKTVKKHKKLDDATAVPAKK